jgi:phosphohistidine phosphatase
MIRNPMRLYLLRHGLAAPALPGQPDEQRPLTAEGETRIVRQAQVYRQMPFGIEQVLCSRYVRARQTAERIAEVLGAPVYEDARIGPDMSLDDLAVVLSDHAGPWETLVVGHQPAWGQIVRHLTGANVEMQPGTLAVIEVTTVRPGHGLLGCVLQPEMVTCFGTPGV